MSYKLVLIDLDDTLFDYPKTEEAAFRNTFKELGFFVESELSNDKKEEIYEKIKDRYKDVNLQLWKDLEKGAVDKDRLKVVRFERIIEEFDLKYDSYEMSELYLKKLGEGIFPSLGVSIPSFLLTIGMGLLGFGLSAFCALGVSPLIQFTKNNFIKLAKRLSKKGARHA